MTRVTVDANVQHLLLNFTKPLELCDESGAVRAKLVPCPADDSDEWIDLTPDLTDEELEAEIDSGEGYSTQELIAEIKKLRGI
ncbi:MAG: hypothetical protein U0805_20730 [Pirellulales bacterium]